MDALRLPPSIPSARAGPDSRPRPRPPPSNGITLDTALPPSRLLGRLWTGRSPEAEQAGGRRSGSWVMKILQVRSLWGVPAAAALAEKKEGRDEEEVGGGDRTVEEMDGGDRCVGCIGCGCGEGSDGCDVSGEEGVEFDRESFSPFLQRVSLMEAKLYAKMSYLGAMAYSIPKIKPVNLLRRHGLLFVTSSLEKKARSSNKENKEMASQSHEVGETPGEEETVKLKKSSYRISASAAYSIAASAASYIQSQTRGILPFSSRKGEITNELLKGGSRNEDDDKIASSEMLSFMATTDSVTAVVAAKEEIKQAVAKDLNSARSPPCEWFICDDVAKRTRYFAIQGSETLASWQANLLFEPVQFEGFDVLVHRGIYEAAKGIYKQMLPEIQDHLKSHGKFATFRFTGHSLGGSLSVLVSLMLLIRGEVPLSSLLPVVTFGAPCILCGGDYLLHKLGLPQNHVQSIMMHRDIVPRAFSCNYPDHVAKILKAVNGKFRNHPCLKNQKLLYAPLGKLLILQPEEKYSPYHHLLPSGSGLYILGHSSLKSHELLQAAQSTFLNSPHPLEILRDRAAYSSRGTITRNHQVLAYFRSLYGLVREELKLVKKAKKEYQAWWPNSDNGFHSGITMHWQSTYVTGHRYGYSAVLHGGKAALKRLGRLVVSRHAAMLVMVLLPARSLFLGILAVVRLG